MLKEGYWLPYDAQPQKIRTRLSNAELKKYLEEIATRQLLLVSDSCFSGTLLKRAEDIGDENPDAARIERKSQPSAVSDLPVKLVLTAAVLRFVTRGETKSIIMSSFNHVNHSSDNW